MALLATLWILTISGLFVWHFQAEYKQVIDLADVQGAHTFEKDLIYRHWASSHGGVYVPPSEQSPPNPYLNVPDRDIITTTGLELTLINPAYMTRQVYEMMKHKQTGLRGHITSLNPLRPENAPDAWEVDALKQFEGGRSKVAELVEIDGYDYYRIMHPMFMETSCLKCHADQGYEEGDIRGGISVAVPMKLLWASLFHEMQAASLIYGFLLFLGLYVIYFAVSRFGASRERLAQADMILTDKNETLAEIGAVTQAGSWELDPDDQQVFWSDETYRLHGVPIGQKISLEKGINFYHPDDRQRIGLVVRRAIEQKNAFDFTARLIAANGRLLWVRATGKPVIEKGRLVKLKGVFNDITESKLAEDLARANKKIERKNRELESVISATTHDITSPLTSIDGFSDVLESSLENVETLMATAQVSSPTHDKLSQSVQLCRESIGYIKKSTERVQALLDGLAQVGQVGQVPLEKERLDMNGLIGDLLDVFRYKIDQSKATVHVADLPSCVADASQMKQLFSNLIGNALKYADPEKPCVIDIRGDNRQGQVVYSVADSGIGIPSDVQEQIFEVFTQLDSRSEGMGLGLSIVRKIVERHDGRLWVESTPGEGSTFFVSFGAAG